jgi:hypothetical protein
MVVIIGFSLRDKHEQLEPLVKLRRTLISLI